MENNTLSDHRMADLAPPSFIVVETGDVLINLEQLNKTGGFSQFVDRLFSSGLKLTGLNYDLLCRLLYIGDLADSKEMMRLATSITEFPEDRRKLYHKVKLIEKDSVAEYFFEPVLAETTADNSTPVLLELDVDEFIADMWNKNVRFGLDVTAIKHAIAQHRSERVVVARHLPPTLGSDATIKEMQEGLHCDNSPKITASGRVDWSSRKNRFPQVHKDALLLKKIPRKLGKSGFDVTGRLIEAEIPKDLEFSSLCGAGTYLKLEDNNEYVVASLDGFVTFESNGTVSVTEKIENRAGVSTKTTGNLTLDVEEFVEHGEVQEKCVVHGKHMTFMSDVFGNIISDGGNVVINKNLSGGSVDTNHSGNVTLKQRTSQATVRVPEGSIVAEICEHAHLIANTVHVKRAINCEIIAQTVIAEEVAGCLIVAENVQIASSSDKRDVETLVTLLVPDLTVFDKEIFAIKKQMNDTADLLTERRQALQHLKSEPEFAKFLSLHEQIKSGAIKLNAEQNAQWQKLNAKHAVHIKQLVKLSGEANELDKVLHEQQQEKLSIEQQRDEQGENIACQIQLINGMTTIQTLRSEQNIAQLSLYPLSDIRQKVQTMNSSKAKLYSSDSGTLAWRFKEKK